MGSNFGDNIRQVIVMVTEKRRGCSSDDEVDET